MRNAAVLHWCTEVGNKCGRRGTGGWNVYYLRKRPTLSFCLLVPTSASLWSLNNVNALILSPNVFFTDNLHLLLPEDVNSMVLQSSVLRERAQPSKYWSKGRIQVAFGCYCTAIKEYQLLSYLFHGGKSAWGIFLLAVSATDGKHTNRKAGFLDLYGGWQNNNLEDKPQSLSLQEFTVINCQLLSLIFPLIKTPEGFST